MNDNGRRSGGLRTRRCKVRLSPLPTSELRKLLHMDRLSVGQNVRGCVPTAWGTVRRYPSAPFGDPKPGKARPVSSDDWPTEFLSHLGHPDPSLECPRKAVVLRRVPSVAGTNRICHPGM